MVEKIVQRKRTSPSQSLARLGPSLSPLRAERGKTAVLFILVKRRRPRGRAVERPDAMAYDHGMSIRYRIGSALAKLELRRAARMVASWHIPITVVAAVACLVAGVTLPLLVVHEFFVYGQKLSVVDGVKVLFDEGDWFLAIALGAFSIVLPLLKNGILLALWWRLRQGRPARDWLVKALDTSGRWAMLDVFVVALVIVEMKAHLFIDIHVTGAVYPCVAAVALTIYAARAVSRVAGQPAS